MYKSRKKIGGYELVKNVDNKPLTLADIEDKRHEVKYLGVYHISVKKPEKVNTGFFFKKKKDIYSDSKCRRVYCFLSKNNNDPFKDSKLYFTYLTNQNDSSSNNNKQNFVYSLDLESFQKDCGQKDKILSDKDGVEYFECETEKANRSSIKRLDDNTKCVSEVVWTRFFSKDVDPIYLAPCDVTSQTNLNLLINYFCKFGKEEKPKLATIISHDKNKFELVKTVRDNKKWVYTCNDLNEFKNGKYKNCKAQCFDGNKLCANVPEEVKVSAKLVNDDITLAHTFKITPTHAKGIIWDCKCGKPKKKFFSRKTRKDCKCKSSKFAVPVNNLKSKQEQIEEDKIRKRINDLDKML